MALTDFAFSFDFPPIFFCRFGTLLNEMSLSAEAVKILKTTAPVVRQHGPAITTAMYRIMIEEHPEIKNLFNNSHLRQTEDGQVSPQVIV